MFCWLMLQLTSATPQVQCQETTQAPTDPAKDLAVPQNSNPSTVEDTYLIRAGDTVDVSVERRPEFNWRGSVNSDGTISGLPYIKKEIRALCRTVSAVAIEIATAYGEFIKGPNITVRVVERSREPAILLGAIRTPQRFEVQRDVRLIELLFISGGVTDRASGDIQVFSPVPTFCNDAGTPSDQATREPKAPLRVIKIMDLMGGASDANPIIRAGDVVTVMAAEPVYVTGGVASPQGINFRDQMMLSHAIATAGGLTSNARSSEIRIYRSRGAETDGSVIRADYDAIRKHKRPDIPLKPYDIIEVPQSAGGPDRRDWQLAAQDIVTEQRKADTLPIRVLN